MDRRYKELSDLYLQIMLILFFLLAEVDRVRLGIAAHEADLLQNQYQGSICHASCSELQDEQNIWTEIGNKRNDVDKAIQVLLKAGMTSDALRHAHLQGVALKHSGVVLLAIPVLVLGPLLMAGFWQLGRHVVLLWGCDERVTYFDWFYAPLQALSIVARLGFLTLLLRSSVDERCFMLNVMAKTIALVWSLFLFAQSLQRWMPSTLTSVILYHLSFVVVWSFALLGIRGTLKLPFGKCLAEVFLSRIISWKTNHCRHRLVDTSDASSTSETSETPETPETPD
ncbi:Uncharacterized protein SCF082_LOCUS620 [Durusdinium trenchii]|uniref:Uncharacterized protein n=1 Tax=Durusdinium trenchii TaxID=1381693 RepID=A0ABP0HCQ1_9DINO